MLDAIASLEGINNMNRRALDEAKRTLHFVVQNNIVKNVHWLANGIPWIDRIIKNVETCFNKACISHPTLCHDSNVANLT